MPKQLESPEFYVNCDGGEYVWHGPRFSVVRFGQIELVVPGSFGQGQLIEYTPDLLEAGITTDQQLAVAYGNQTNFEDSRPYFEIEEMGVESYEFCPNSYETLSEAIAAATEMENN